MRTRHSRARAALLAAFLLAVVVPYAAGDVAELAPDTILVNGKVLTVDRSFRIVEAVAIKGDTFVGVGSNREIRPLAGPRTQVVDLGGRTVIPGIFDAHSHLDREGLKFLYPALTSSGNLEDPGVKSIDELLKVIEREVKKKKPGEWIVTMPIGDYPFHDKPLSQFAEKRLPNRWDLDKVSPNNPVYIRSPWYYWPSAYPLVSIANSQALKLAGITKETMPPHSLVTIVKDEATGEPTGVFLEYVQSQLPELSILKVIPRFTHEERVRGIRVAMQRYNAVGVTSHNEGHGISSEVLAAYKELWDNGELTVRSYLYPSPAWDSAPQADVDELLADWATSISGRGFGDDMLQLLGMPAAAGTNAADAIRRGEAPYTCWASYGADQSLPPERGSLDDLVLAMVKAGIRPVGGSALIASLAKANQQVPIADRRIHIYHLSTTTEEQMDTIKRLNIVPSTIAGSIWKGGSAAVKGLTEAQLNLRSPYKTLLAKGIPLTFASDNIPISPFHSMWAAIARKARDTGQVIGPSQRLTREEALRCATINGAYLTFEEGIKGSIEVGKLADLVVLKSDYMTVPEDQIKDIEVFQTIVGGKTVYKNP